MQDDIMESSKALQAEAYEKDFSQWKKTLKHTGKPSFLPTGLIIDVATDPNVWLTQAVGVLDISSDTRRKFMGLPYSIFLLAAEWFLKGMWILKNHPQWMFLDTLVSREERVNLEKELRGLTDGGNHDLEELIQKIRPFFLDDEHVAEFLDVLDGIVYHYWPYYRGGEDWVACRYPTWIYDEKANKPLSYKDESMLRKVDVCELFKRCHSHLCGR